MSPTVKVSVADTTADIPELPTTFKVLPATIVCVVELVSLNIKPVGDAAYFTNLENRKTKSGHVFNPGDAFKANQIQFAGYPKDGQFEYDGRSETGLNNSKPVYVYEYEKGGKQFRVIMQF